MENIRDNYRMYRDRCLKFGLSNNDFLLSNINQKAIDNAVQNQINVVGGSNLLYQKLNESMAGNKFEAYFIKEQCSLYTWREDFFNSHFPGDSWYTVDEDEYDDDEFYSWDDSFTRDITIPFQLTHNFDTVVQLATVELSPELSWLKSCVYLPNDEFVSNEAASLYKRETMLYDLNILPGSTLYYHFDQLGLTFSEVAHMIVEFFHNGPKKLEELAIKTILIESVSIKTLPKSIQKKFVFGMYSVTDDVPANLSDHGKKIFKKARKAFVKMDL